MFTRSSHNVPDPVTYDRHTRLHQMRVGLFVERDTGTQAGLAATVDALIAHRPRDASFIEYAGQPNLKALLSVRELVARAAADRIDVVHVATTGPLAIVAFLVASSFRLPVIAFYPPDALLSDGPFRAYRRALVRYSRRLMVSSMTARAMLATARVERSRIRVWRPGVDTTMFAPSKRSSAIRELWGASDTRPAVIYAGELSDDRGAQRMVSLEAELHRTRPIHQLLVAGDGPSHDVLHARCPRARFLGQVPRSAMPEVLASADLFVCPSEASSTNLAVLEAQASGLPVIVMERGSASERVTAATARVCRSQADFIVETAALIRTDSRRAGMGLAAREYAKEQDWATGLTAVYAEYRSAAELSRARRNLQPAFIPQRRRL